MVQCQVMANILTAKRYDKKEVQKKSLTLPNHCLLQHNPLLLAAQYL